MSDAAAAVANELATMLEDVLDDAEGQNGVLAYLPDAGGSAECSMVDTQPGSTDLQFVVVLQDGRKVLVTCEEPT